MKYKNKTKYTFEVLSTFNNYHLNHAPSILFANALAIIFALSMLYSYVIDRTLSNLLFMLIFILMTGLIKFINARIVSYRLKKLDIKETTNSYEFYDDYLVYNKNEIKYKDFKKIKFDKGFIYFYINKISAYIVDTREMDDKEEFIRFIKEAKKRK